MEMKNKLKMGIMIWMSREKGQPFESLIPIGVRAMGKKEVIWGQNHLIFV